MTNLYNKIFDSFRIKGQSIRTTPIAQYKKRGNGITQQEIIYQVETRHNNGTYERSLATLTEREWQK